MSISSQPSFLCREPVQSAMGPVRIGVVLSPDPPEAWIMCRATSSAKHHWLLDINDVGAMNAKS